MITVSNYQEKKGAINWAAVPKTVKENRGDIESWLDLYGEDNDIDSVIDTFMEKVNASVKETAKPKKPKTKPAKKAKKNKPKFKVGDKVHWIKNPEEVRHGKEPIINYDRTDKIVAISENAFGDLQYETEEIDGKKKGRAYESYLVLAKSKTKPRTNTKKTSKKVNPKVDVDFVNAYSEEFKLLRRFLNATKKDVLSFRSLQLLYMAFQKAAVARKVRKTSDKADEFTAANNVVTKIFDEAEASNRAKKNGIKLVVENTKLIEEIQKYVSGKKINYGITLLNSFIGMQGTRPGKEKAARLLKRIENGIKKDKVSKTNRLYDEVKEAVKELKEYLKEPKKEVDVTSYGLSSPCDNRVKCEGLKHNGLKPGYKFIEGGDVVKVKKKDKSAGLAITAEDKETVDFNKAILKAKRNGIDPGKTFNLGQSKGILKKYAGKGDITLSGKTIKKSMDCHDKDHCIDWSYYINLPDHINKPFAIFKSETVTGSLVVLVELKNHLGKPLLVALKLDKNNETKDVRSVYSKRTKKVYQKWRKEELLLYGDEKSDLFRSTVGPIPTQSKKPLSKNKDTKKPQPTKKQGVKKPPKGLKGPVGDIVKKKAVETVGQIADHAVKEATKSIAKTKKTVSKKVKNIGASKNQKANFYNVPGEVGKFLQAVERKPAHSVVITLDGHQGAGKTTFLYQMMNAFAAGGNRGVFMSLEEHPESHLAREKAAKFIRSKNQKYLDIVGDLDGQKEFFDIVKDYDVIYIDSWQKLQRMVGKIRLDEDLRKKFDGKVFVVIFQQTTTGRTKGGAEIVFDGDIIIKLVKEDKFEDNYGYFDKNRYTKRPLENLRYNIANAKFYDPEAKNEPQQKPSRLVAREIY